jgi:hypothetical protein
VMQGISIPYIFNVAIALDGLNRLPSEGVKFGEVSSEITNAFQALVSLHASDTIYGPHFRSCLLTAGRLLNVLKPHIDEFDPYKDISAINISEIKAAYSNYKIALQAELGSFQAYFVVRKAPYDTLSLLENGETLFPPDLASKAPDAVFDIREAAKCLAYEMPTACGFHAFRAMETVLRRYYGHVTGGKALPKVRNLGVYINALAKDGDPKLLSSLTQVKDLHRNPLIHPETVLTTEEAINILGLVRSAVSVMLAALPAVPPTTTTLPTP